MRYYEYSVRNVEFGGSTLPGVISGGAAAIYTPVGGSDVDHIAVVFSYAPPRITEQLAKRGFTVVSVTHRGLRLTRADAEIAERALSVQLARSLPGVDTVLGLSWSGGTNALTAYQAMAEKGISIFQHDGMLMPVSSIDHMTKNMVVPDCFELSPFDGILMLDANWGAAMQLVSLDPAVRIEGNGRNRDPELDLFNPENGFKVGGCEYSQEFIRKFQRGQAKRMNRLIEYCQERIELINKGKGKFADDEPLVVTSGNSVRDNNQLFSQDVRLLSRTKGEWPVLHGDGSFTVEQVKTVREPMNFVCLTGSYRRGVKVTSVKRFLRESAIRVSEDFEYGADYMNGVDWDSTYASNVGNLKHVTVPMFLAGMSASWEFALHEQMYAASASRDKELIFVEGANHILLPENSREAFPGQFGDTYANTMDYLKSWIGDGSRFHK